MTRVGALDLGTAYAEIQDRMLAAAQPDRLGTPIPACPAWTARDVVGHVAGLAKDAVDGSLPSFNLLDQWRDESIARQRDEMTDAHVVRSRAMPFDDVVDEWRRTTKTLLPMLRGNEPFPGTPPFGMDAILVTDLWVHDSDIGSALGRPRPADDAATSIALAAYSFGIAPRLDALGLAPLGLRYGEKVRVIGAGEPAATVTADRYELVRMLAGRRSRRQIAAMDWEGDPTPYLAIIPAYGERADDLAG
ncbi:MAG: maleylpyruvate isomerase family mycothiol-dependent enzyme [Actinomycetes bacterium]